MARSERQDDGTRIGVGTLTRSGTRPRPQQAPEAGQPAPHPRRDRPSRPVPTQRTVADPQAASGQRLAPGPRTADRPDQGAPGQTARPGLRRRAGVPSQAAQPGRANAPGGPHRMPFVLLLCGLLGGALVSALVISTTLAEGSFQISKLQDSTSSLAKQRQELQAAVAQAQSPERIAQRASQLGMRRTSELRYLDLKTGKVTSTGPVWSGAVNAPGYAP